MFRRPRDVALLVIADQEFRPRDGDIGLARLLEPFEGANAIEELVPFHLGLHFWRQDHQR